MNALHRHLHLKHHRHTGRRLHHRHTSYRALALVFVLAGITMLLITALARSTAQAFDVGATVKAPVPTIPPLITSLEDGSTVHSASQLVAGSCPLITPQVVVLVNIDGAPAGSAICDGANDFALPVRLAPGSHTLAATALTITEDTGPTSPPAHITYLPGIADTLGTVTSQPNGPVTTPNPLTISGESPLLWLGSNRTVSWTGTLAGGTPPYRVLVDWGDGNQQAFTRGAGISHFDHTYAAPSPRDAVISITDAAHTALSRQFAVAGYTAASLTLSAGNTASSATANTAFSGSPFIGLYGLYLTALAVTGIIWLEAKHAAREFVRAHP